MSFDQFVPVTTEANLTLSFDHRVLDGGGPNSRVSPGLHPVASLSRRVEKTHSYAVAVR
jgi:hypothetical protein